MNLFAGTEYKSLINEYIESLPKKGRGELRRLANSLGVSPVIVTQVLRGERHFSEEQAFDLCGHFGFTELETEYFVSLVRYARAGKENLKQHLLGRIQSLQLKSREIASRIHKTKALDEGAKARYYSYWYYGAVRLLAATPKMNTARDIGLHLHISTDMAQQLVEFLLEFGLLQQKNGRLEWIEQSTHIDKSSPLVNRHHQNWRQKALVEMEKNKSENMFFTGPVVLDIAAESEIKTQLLEFIQKASKVIKDADCEKLRCLNIDWFEF